MYGVILVSLLVNGNPAVLILDTGSSTTILSPEVSGLDPINLRRAGPPKNGTGFVGDGHWGEETPVTGERIWKDRRILGEDMKDIPDTKHRKIDVSVVPNKRACEGALYRFVWKCDLAGIGTCSKCNPAPLIWSGLRRVQRRGLGGGRKPSLEASPPASAMLKPAAHAMQELPASVNSGRFELEP